MERDRGAGAARAGVRVGDLRRGRLDARPDAGDRPPARPRAAAWSPSRTSPAPGSRASGWRRCWPRRPRAARRTCSRCAATRRAATPLVARPRAALSSSLELAALAADAGFCVLGACYPEPHPDSRGWAADLEHLRAKVDAGVRVLVTQLFFDNADYRRFIERLRAAGIDVPVLPGIIPVTSVGQIDRMTALCGATIPDALPPRAGGPPGRPARGRRPRRGLRHRPGRGAARRGRPRRAPLHAQPLAGDARGRLGAARPGRAKRRPGSPRGVAPAGRPARTGGPGAAPATPRRVIVASAAPAAWRGARDFSPRRVSRTARSAVSAQAALCRGTERHRDRLLGGAAERAAGRGSVPAPRRGGPGRCCPASEIGFGARS